MDLKKRSAITVRLDYETREAARKVFNDLGMDLSTGINIYLKQVARDKQLPFKPSLRDPLNEATQHAHKEISEGDYQTFNSLESLLKDLNDDH
ncbi:type II toxin-antitoxin system RelB/DinJ family antitoxin [Lactobacillus sp. CC-MHH1034]|uniref:type II toxin-antitoxin system RelB/DinJ family antitoxin n=1 Tax=Agrilactobacillus fermenti TaxID=2586909 RepID=UPI001E342689|nr:type II toxin-antitoxin system RelB/DinJ family antitoxin [Agrilactobacillus fermenti]MCD2256041.1 type II toxin-antitoxin system RelB/DinJ family antitoxin [Agrilactobacillus fermenti]